MSDDAGRLEEDGSQTDGGVKRAGRARICKQCRFTTTSVREFSHHRLHAHAEENPDEKVVNRKAGAKRRSSSVANAVAVEDQKNKSAVLVGTAEDINKTKEASVENKTKEAPVEYKVAENQGESKTVVVDPSADIKEIVLIKDTVNDTKGNEKVVDSEIKEVDEEKVKKIEQPAEQNIEIETQSETNKTEQVEKMESERISEELLNSLALARKVPAVPTENGKVDQSLIKRPSTEKILIEKHNGTTQEVLLINRGEEEPDEEPRLIIADDSEMMDHSGLDPHSLYRSGNIQNRTYLCNQCDYSTSNAKSYLHHQKDAHHPELVIYECDFCDYATKYKQKLPRHRKLHFSGKEGLNESDLDNSLTERELRAMKESSSFNADFVNGEEEMDEEGDIEEDEEEEIAVALTGASPSSRALVGGEGAPVEKKKRIRQEVDPLKYFEVMDESGVKYACSKCGNVYKWRKSLNKHWKEKHFGEVPDLTKPPATLQNYTLFSRYKPKAGGQPPPPAAPNVVYGAAIPSPTNQQKSRGTPTSKSDDLVQDLPSMVPHRQLMPFMQSSSPELFHSQLLSLASPGGNRMPENHHDMRKMIDDLQRRSNALKSRKLQLSDRTSPLQENSQHEPIDYSKPLDFSRRPDIKLEPNFGDNNSESADSLQEMPLSMSQANSQIAMAMKQSNAVAISDSDNPVLQCSKCSFVAKTLVDYSAHMSLHLNKRAFKCAECQSHFNGVEELNRHFLENHSEKIQEHKEAIQKIPHGLQQTYHLLKMPLDSISNLSTQELLSNEPKQLKCSMCNFVAKWPAELQKHAVSHSEERPFVCMVCGSTYKWKWDLVKHFEKSHNSLPNPYKRREGGGVTQTGSSSPSTPPLEQMSRATSALMESGMTGDGYTMDEDSSISKKRRLSETDFQDTEEFYRELLERQIKHRREMGQSSESLHLNRPGSAPFGKSNDSGKDGYTSSDSMDSLTPKHFITEALKYRIKTGKHLEEESLKQGLKQGKSDVVLPYKCQVCEYRARWPSEISQHMKNHSNEKPFHCPRCSYKSKWKWDVVKHLRRCGGGTVHDVIDTSKIKKMAPPNVMVLPQGNMQQQIQQSPKISPGQSLYQVNQRAKSLSPAINNNRLLNANFSLGAGGQNHQAAMMELMTQNGYLSKSMSDSHGYNLEKDGLYHCMECPFVGSSQAELKRHAVLHSENKPFACNMCGYSSRWKCDLKKHMKVYNHFNTNIVEMADDVEIQNDKYEEDFEDDSDEEKSTLYMCPQCPYNSYKKSAFEHHLRIHGNLISPNDDLEPLPTNHNDTPSSSKFKCSKCDYQGNDLSSFLQHKRSHGNQTNSTADNNESPITSESRSLSPAPSEVSNRTVHLKHRRKPVKQFRCDKCPYICFKRSALVNHDNLHQSQGNDAYLCMFCDYNVFSKNLLLQHMRLHPEYNPAEGSEHDTRVSAAELMEMEELEEKELAGEDRKEPSFPEENNNIDEYESGFDYVTEPSVQLTNRTSTPSNLPSSPERSPQNNNLKEATNNNTNDGADGLPCEWCSCTFPNVVTLYQHAQSLHPTQLKAQEAGDIAAKQAPSKASQLAQIVRERQREYQVYHQTIAQQSNLQQQLGLKFGQHLSGKKFVPLAPKPQIENQSMTPRQMSNLDDEMLMAKQQIAILNARKSASQQKRGRSFQCTKCSFTAPNAVTYLRHIERHGSNCKHTCLYCDYSIDRLNLLYQHMKGTHASKWQGTTEEKIHLSVTGEDSNNNIIDGLGMSDEPMMDDLNGSFNSSTNDSMEEMIQRGESLIDLQKQMIGEQMRMSTETAEMEDRQINWNAMLSPPTAQIKKPILLLKGNTIFKGVMLQVCSLDGKKHYKCPRCVYVNNNAANTANHVKQHGLNKKYTCKHCDYSVDNYKHIQHHMDTVHPTVPEFVIMNSVPPTLLIDDIPEDVSNNIQDQDIQQDLSYKCSKCPYRGVNKERFQVHLSRHQGTGNYECQLCDYSVDKYSILREHAQLHSNKLTTEQMEDVEMQDKDNDSNGLNSGGNSESVRYKCSCCPYNTSKKTEILRHRLNHLNKSALSCQLCTYSSNDNGELQLHLKFHQNKQSSISNQTQEITLDPYNDSYKLIEQVENGSDDIEMMEEVGVFEGVSEDNAGDFDDSAEVAMMEEELRETYGQIGERISVNLNAEGAFDKDIQFRAFKCKLCPFSSNSSVEFKNHCRLHGATHKFKCDYCTYSLDRVNLISQHRKLHINDSDFEPSPLVKTLLNKDHEDYENTLSNVGNEIAYPPNEVGSKLADESSGLNSFCQNSGTDDRIRYVCNKCPYRCQALKNFRCHMQMHGLIRKYKCDYCDWSAERLNLLYQHRKVHASQPGFDSSPGDIQFLNRKYILDNEGNSEKNVNYALMELTESPLSESKLFKQLKKSGPKSHFCKLCPYQTDNINSYWYHKKLHCIQALYNCSECSYSINNILSLKEHTKLHKKKSELLKLKLNDSGNLQKCLICPYKSPNKNWLVNHMAMHASGRSHTCNHCDFSTDKQTLLEIHLKVHEERYSDYDSPEDEVHQLMKHNPDVTGPQLYFSMANLNDLDSDSNDTGDLDLKCDQCPFSTPSKDELGNHIQHHGSDTKSPLNCTFCTFSCSKEDELLQHAQVHFPSTKIDWDMMKQLQKQHQSYRKNLSKSFPDVDTGKDNKSGDESGEPDSTVNDTGKSDTVTDTDGEKTKVYVCQFCEREFDCKTTMLQHEKQHLVGT